MTSFHLVTNCLFDLLLRSGLPPFERSPRVLDTWLPYPNPVWLIDTNAHPWRDFFIYSVLLPVGSIDERWTSDHQYKPDWPTVLRQMCPPSPVRSIHPFIFIWCMYICCLIPVVSHSHHFIFITSTLNHRGHQLSGISIYELIFFSHRIWTLHVIDTIYYCSFTVLFLLYPLYYSSLSQWSTFSSTTLIFILCILDFVCSSVSSYTYVNILIIVFALGFSAAISYIFL